MSTGKPAYFSANGGRLNPDDWQLSLQLAIAYAKDRASERKELEFERPEVCLGGLPCTRVEPGQLTSSGDATVRYKVHTVDAWEPKTGGWLPWERPEEDPLWVVFPDGTTLPYDEYRKEAHE